MILTDLTMPYFCRWPRTYLELET
jgi:hypothetical protein